MKAAITNGMVKVGVIVAFLSFAFACGLTAEDVPSVSKAAENATYLENPKELRPPIRLVAAQWYLDAGSVDGKLRDKDGRFFYFFFDWNGFDSPTHGLYVFSAPRERHRARFENWREEDLCLILETVIKAQFRWDAGQQRLVPNNPSEFEELESAKSFASSTAKRLLRYSEAKLGRSGTYMKP